MIFEKGQGRTKVRLDVKKVGEDLLLILTGGKPHLGSVSMRGKMHTDHQAKNHHDLEVGKEVADIIHEKTGKDVVCIAGIHIDNATKEEIEKIKENCKLLGLMVSEDG
jgi:hypothetical protein